MDSVPRSGVFIRNEFAATLPSGDGEIAIADRRRSPRFRQTALLRGTDGEGRKLAGGTRDIGPKGIFFVTAAPVAFGSRLYVVVSMEAGGIFSHPVQLYCTGSVVRLEPHKRDLLGVAVAVDRMKIVHAGSDRSE